MAMGTEDLRETDEKVELPSGARLAVRWWRPAGAAAGPTMVFLHEGLGAISIWRSFPETLCARTGLEGLAFDRQGHGRSSPLATPRGTDYLHRHALDELPALRRAVGLDDVVLVGHSDGATVALLHASRHSVRAVVSIAGHVRVEDEALEGIRAACRAWSDGGLRSRLARHHGEQVDAVFAAWSETWLAPWFRGWDVRAELRSATCPVLALQGADDSYASPGHLDELADCLGGPVERWLVPGCGHAPHLDAAEVVLDRVAAFVGARSDIADIAASDVGTM